ncbi:MAG: low molecular weight protein-tyrosine-phosphatase [Halioglobus sp.]
MPEQRSEPVGVLFVCLGNICRSPTAHGVFQHKINAAGLGHTVSVDSCGTGNWHAGEPPDGRASAAAALRGYDLSELRARQVTPHDFDQYDFILAMDESNLEDLRAMAPSGYSGQLALFLDFASGLSDSTVPDPYYGGENGFDEVLDLIETASEGLLKAVVRERS